MWRHLLSAVAAAGRRAIGLDLPGYGDSPPVVHDWGGLIGLRWACDHPDAVAGLVISNTGFFPDGEWHELGRMLRTTGQGEMLIDSVSHDGLAALLGNLAHRIDDQVIDEYWKAFASEAGRCGMLELFRSGNLEKLEPYQGKLAALEVPALVLWGDNKEYTPSESAERFGHEIPHADVVMIDNAGHFLWDDQPEACAREVVDFLRQDLLGNT